MADENQLVPTAIGEIVAASGVDRLLEQIRPHWQAKSLIQRVKRLLSSDPSSACQRLLNAAIQDLREKIIIAGLDIATQAASANKLPPIHKNEDILEEYSTLNILSLAYRMGLLTRPEWKRIRRAYDIRRDLEHEDDEYEAGVEDCVYIFKTCIEIVLAREPIELLRVRDVKEVIEAPKQVALSEELLRNFERAPDPRQIEISMFLIGIALDGTKPDLTRQNAVEALRALRPTIRNTVNIELARELNEKVRHRPFDLAQVKVAAGAGFLPYLKQSQTEAFFSDFANKLESAGYSWKNGSAYADLLDDLEDIGGLAACPAAPRCRLVLWMTLCYLGEPGGYGQFGRNRPVFYSDFGGPLIARMIRAAGTNVRDDLRAATGDPRVKAAVRDRNIARRLENLLDMTEKEE
jgi:hypothetical protein